jgi:hypothetical protein
MTGTFGTALRVPLGAPRPRITVDMVAAHAATLTAATAALHPDRSDDRLDVLDADTVVATTSLTALADAMNRARIAPDAIDVALTAWVEHRPATLADAVAHGHAVLDWADAACTRLHWAVVVLRPGGHLAAVPDVFTAASDLDAIREAAMARSRSLARHAARTGALTLLTADPPVLSTAALAADLPGTGGDILFVVTPGAPVAYGHPAAVRRLAAETNEAHAVVDGPALHALTW